MLAIDARFLNVCITHGYAVDRWCHVVNCLIEKDPGHPKINRLRVIHLYEADYNLILKIMWRRLLRHADNHNALLPDQWGSRPGKNSIEVVVLKQFTYMLAHLLHMPLACFDNDAAACYDRIIPALAMMSCRRLGLPTNLSELNASMLAQARYRVKTLMGIAELFFLCAFGTGQGSGNSPMVWLAVSILLIGGMAKLCEGISVQSPTGKYKAKRNMDAFVDDSTTWVGSFDNPLCSPRQLGKKLQQSAQTWEQLLSASGGKLQLSKCFFYMMCWKWDTEGKPTLMTSTQMNYDMKMIDTQSGTIKSIKKKECTDAHRTLGAWPGPFCKETHQPQNLKDKSVGFARIKKTIKITKRLTDISNWMLYLPSMIYLLPSTCLTKKDLDKVESPVTREILNASGYYNSNFPRVAV